MLFFNRNLRYCHYIFVASMTIVFMSSMVSVATTAFVVWPTVTTNKPHDSMPQHGQQRSIDYYLSSKGIPAGQSRLYASSRDDDNLDSGRASFSKEDTACLQERLSKMRIQVLEEELRRPPNPNLSPAQVVLELLEGLQACDDPLPDSGYRLLLRASTPTWRTRCFKAVGAPLYAPADLVASALGDAMTRPFNQFEILVTEDEEYTMDIVKTRNSGVVYEDNGQQTCWVECQLRSSNSQKNLLVTLGVQLCKRRSDGAWLVHDVDWQDFRDAYRRGSGREDRMRDTMRRLGCL